MAFDSFYRYLITIQLCVVTLLIVSAIAIRCASIKNIGRLNFAFRNCYIPFLEHELLQNQKWQDIKLTFVTLW